MRVHKLLGALAATGVALSPIAAAAQPAVNSLSSVTGDAVVARGGHLIRAVPHMALQANDRVITRNGGSATLAGNGCSVTLGSGEMKTVSGNGCGSSVASFDRAGYAGRGSALSGGGVVIAILAVAAVGAGIYVAVDKNHSRPNSP